MWWRIIVEVLILAAFLITGGGFWACVKSSKHLNQFLADSRELQRLIDHIGPAKIAEESRGIQPIFGSYAKNIETFERIHLASLRQAATRVLIGILSCSLSVSYSVFTTFSPVSWCSSCFPSATTRSVRRQRFKQITAKAEAEDAGEFDGAPVSNRHFELPHLG
jgi:hypothetical protein